MAYDITKGYDKDYRKENPKAEKGFKGEAMKKALNKKKGKCAKCGKMNCNCK